MKKSVLASLLAAALASGTALAQSDPSTLPDASSPALSAPAGTMDDGSTTAGSSLDRSSESYDSGNSGRGAAGRAYDGGTSDGMSGDSSAAGAQGPSSMDGSGSMGSSAQGSGTMAPDGSSSMSSGTQPSTTGMGTTTTYDSGLGAAGRSYDGSTASGPASRSEVTADRDRALRSERWIFNDLDGVQRLEPGWNSHAGRVYKGPAESY